MGVQLIPALRFAGDDHQHWFRAKFFQRYRLFFRYHAPGKVIVFAWVNDEDTKRAYESSDGAYRALRKMPERGHPPDDWSQLLVEARAEVCAWTSAAGPCARSARLSSLPQHLCRPLVQAFARRLRSNKRSAMDLRRYT